MKQLCQNIANNEPMITPGCCSPDLRDLVKELLLKDCHVRPGINAVLMRPVVRNRISSFLDATKRSREFSHTGTVGQSTLSFTEGFFVVFCSVLYCIILYCFVPHCIFYCIELNCIVLHCIALHCIVLSFIGLYRIVLYCIALN